MISNFSIEAEMMLNGNALFYEPVLHKRSIRFREIKELADPPPPSRIHLFHTWFSRGWLTLAVGDAWHSANAACANAHAWNDEERKGRRKKERKREKCNLFIFWDMDSL